MKDSDNYHRVALHLQTRSGGQPGAPPIYICFATNTRDGTLPGCGEIHTLRLSTQRNVCCKSYLLSEYRCALARSAIAGH